MIIVCEHEWAQITLNHHSSSGMYFCKKCHCFMEEEE